MLFSATLPQPIVASKDLEGPGAHRRGAPSGARTGVSQASARVRGLKTTLLLELLKRGEIENGWSLPGPSTAPTGCSSRWSAQGSVRPDPRQSQPAQRSRAASFKSGGVEVLVATDIAARGIDVAALSHAVNFDVPDVPDDYVHRVGPAPPAPARSATRRPSVRPPRSCW